MAVYRETSGNLLHRRGHVTEGDPSTAPKAEGTRGHVGWDIRGVQEQS